MQGSLAPGLYVVATPIGNAADISLRALSVLAGVDAILAEDTRVTAKLLALHGIKQPLRSYNDHNAPRERPAILARLTAGETLALVSDAGTPLVSDPGLKLVREARAAGIPVFAVPGASALLAALSVAGLPTDHFCFAGFLPAREGGRRNALEELAAIPATLVFFESAQRLGATLSQMTQILGEREAAVARELTKLHEEVQTGTLAELAHRYANEAPKGEITIVIGPPAQMRPSGANVEKLLALALPFMPVKEAAQLVSQATGLSRREIYALALKMKERE
ncbi:MAG: 16S rRNA (cytidine(1402)-2'-O)-methyltransferase [Alphaproteobacteria bacterium]